MNKTAALKILIEHSLFLTDTVKKKLLRDMPSLTLKQQDVLGKFLAKEREFILDNEGEILKKTQDVIAYMNRD